ncbi:MAG: hypothetical protein J1E98_14070 [Lachnospiraceae bacterium]|nr:hypothetical protein [Lachnospiraceae bacterium]
MNKLSNQLDRVDKAMDLRNYFIDNQKQIISQEIQWLADNENKPENLRLYFANFLCEEEIIRIGDKGLSQLAAIRGNYLYSQFRRLEQQKMNNSPLKFIVWELKCFGQ